MARKIQAYCAGCGEPFGSTSKRKQYGGKLFHYYQEGCVEKYKLKQEQERPAQPEPTSRVPFRQRVLNIVLAPFWFLRKREENESGATTEVAQPAND